MNKRQVAKAATIYRLSVLAQTDALGASTDDQLLVMERAIADSRAALVRMGHRELGYPSLQACIDAAIGIAQ